jgi:hypothetical protein
MAIQQQKRTTAPAKGASAVHAVRTRDVDLALGWQPAGPNPSPSDKPAVTAKATVAPGRCVHVPMAEKRVVGPVPVQTRDGLTVRAAVSCTTG